MEEEIEKEIAGEKNEGLGERLWEKIYTCISLH